MNDELVLTERTSHGEVAVYGTIALSPAFGNSYEVGPLLGAGAMGCVYRGTQRSMQRPVAIKVLKEVGPELLARFRREAHILAKISHPHVLIVFDCGDMDGHPYLVTELLEGGSLRDRIAKGRLPWADAARLGVDCLEGLAPATMPGSSTATSSRRTSCSPRTARFASRTWAWPPTPATRSASRRPDENFPVIGGQLMTALNMYEAQGLGDKWALVRDTVRSFADARGLAATAGLTLTEAQLARLAPAVTARADALSTSIQDFYALRASHNFDESFSAFLDAAISDFSASWTRVIKLRAAIARAAH